MSRHAQRKSTARYAIASASAVTVSLGSLVALAPSSHAISCPATGTVTGMTSSELYDGTVCELVFLPAGEVTFTPPSGVGKVSALIIGGGSASEESTATNSDTQYAAGGAGEVQYVDDLGTAELTITAGAGQAVGEAGWSGESTVVGAQTYTSVGGGEVQSSIEADGYAWAGDSGNGFSGGLGSDGISAASGAGASADGSAGEGVDDLAGGAGLTSADLSADTDLWPTSDTTEYGVGGSYFLDNTHIPSIASVQGLGQGGSISEWGEGDNVQPGANGSIRIRYSLVAASYTVTFNSNGGSSVDDGTFVEDGDVSEPTDPSKDGYTFVGWSTTLDDSETEVSFPYSPGVTEAITLYALWTEVPPASYTVTFNSNGGSSVDDGTFVEDGDVSEPTDPSKDGYTFVGWSTTLDDSETEVSFPYSPGVTEAITLYALWTEEASPGRASGVSYEGPSGIRQTSSGTCVGDLATITGSRLGTIQNIYVDGTDVPFTLVSDSKINFNIPNMNAGTYQLKYWVPVNNVNLTDKITIASCSVPATAPVIDETEVGSGELTPFYVAKRFTSYRGDRGAIVAADKEAITAFINEHPGLTHITCVGSTSGRPASPTDQALAMARAENACSVVENLVPGITTRMVTSTGLGVGQFYRAVTLFGKGFN